MTRKTSKNNIFYFTEKTQQILDLTLNYSFEEIGFYTIFKNAYFYHKGKIPCEKLLQFCRVFLSQKEFESWVKNFTKIEEKNGEKFYKKREFDDEIKLIENKSDKARSSINKRWKGDTNEYTNEYTNEDTSKNTNPYTKTIKTIKTNKNNEIKNNENYIIFSNSLKEIIENKINKNVSNKKWYEEIRKLIEIDLKNRQNAIEDVKIAIQAVEDYSNESYFPVIQSAKSLREKFSKIENFLVRKKQNSSGLRLEDYQNLKFEDL